MSTLTLRDLGFIEATNSGGVSVVTSGLVQYLDAGNPASYPGSGATWLDLSGNGRNATLENGPTFSTANGGVLVFNGTNNWVLLGTASSLGWSSVRTIACWIGFLGSLTSNAQIISMWDLTGGVNQRTLQLYLDGTTSKFAIYWSPDGTIDPTILRDTTAAQGSTWYYLTVVYRSGVIELWRNGALMSTLSQAAINTSATTNRVGFGVLPGLSSNTPVQYMNGRGSIVQLYNRALSAAEIAQNYLATKSRFGL